MAPGDYAPTAAHCPEGSWVTGGGFSVSDADGFAINASSPGDIDWFVNGLNEGESLLEVRAYAVCMSVTPSTAFSAAHVGAKRAAKDR